MKQLILFFIGFFTVQFLFAQTPELGTSFSAIKTFFLPALSGALLVLFADAKKWMFSGEWSWSVFLNTKLLPFVYGFGGAVVLYFALAFLPFLKPFIEVIGGHEFAEVTAAALVGAATAIIDGLLKPNKASAPTDEADL